MYLLADSNMLGEQPGQVVFSIPVNTIGTDITLEVVVGIPGATDLYTVQTDAGEILADVFVTAGPNNDLAQGLATQRARRRAITLAIVIANENS